MTQTPIPVAESSTTTPSDLQDERLIRPTGVRENISAQIKRVRTGDLGSLPVIIGLVIISIIFEILDPVFLGAEDLTTSCSTPRSTVSFRSASSWSCCSARSTCR